MTRDGYSPTYREPAPPAGLDGVSLTLGEYAEAPSTAGALVFATIIGNSSWVTTGDEMFFGLTVPAGSGVLIPATRNYEVTGGSQAGVDAFDAEFNAEVVIYADETLIGYAQFYSHQQPTIEFDSTINAHLAIEPRFVALTAGQVVWMRGTEACIVQTMQYFLATLTVKSAPADS